MAPKIHLNFLLGSPRSIHKWKLYSLGTSIEAFDLGHKHYGIGRLGGDTCWIELAFIERKWTPDQIIEVGIQLLWLTCQFKYEIVYRSFGCQADQAAIRNWVQKVELQPTGDADLAHPAAVVGGIAQYQRYSSDRRGQQGPGRRQPTLCKTDELHVWGGESDDADRL